PAIKKRLPARRPRLYHPGPPGPDMTETLANFSDAPVYVTQDGDDHAAVQSCLAGNTEAFEILVVRYQRVLFTVAMRMLGDYDEASDATQNAFIRAYRRLGTFDGERRFFSWIYRILVNECLNNRRDRRPHDALTPELATVGSPADLLEVDERRRRVE